MVTLQELLNKYNIKYNYLPRNLLEININNNINNYTQGEKKNQKTIFYAKYKDHNIPVECEVTIDTRNIYLDNVKKLEPYINGEKEFDNEIKELAEKELIHLLLGESVVVVKYSNENFTLINEYNVYGGLIRHS